MYYLGSLLCGILLSVMIVLNGALSNVHGLSSSTMFIHLSGLIVIGIYCLYKKAFSGMKWHAWFIYIGGALGVITVLFNNLSYGKISVSAILALGLLGQSLAGLIVDGFGLFGMKKIKFAKHSLIGISLLLVGIVYMITDFVLMPVLVAFFAGANTVICRSLNGQLSKKSSVEISTFFNYATGFVCSLPVWLLMRGGEAGFATSTFSPQIFIYLGGVVGVVYIYLANVVVSKTSAFYFTLFIFIGQVFSGIVLDMMLSGIFEIRNLVGGILVALGLLTNLYLDKRLTFTDKHS